MHNFNNKTSIGHFEQSQTAPALSQFQISSKAQKEDYATECLILLSEIQEDKLGDSKTLAEWSLLSNVEVAPWASTQFKIKQEANCARSKTSMLLPPCNLRQMATKKQKKRRLTENKENYLSIDKLVKEQKLGEKQHLGPGKKTSSAISKYNDVQRETISVQQFGEISKSKPHIVYVLCDEETKTKIVHKPTKKTEANEYCLAPIVIGKCNLTKKNSKFYTQPGEALGKQKILHVYPPNEANENSKGRKKTLQNIKVGQNLASQESIVGGEGKQQGHYWKIKKKIQDHIRKESHIKLESIQGRQQEPKQVKRYMKYSHCKTKSLRRKDTELDSCYQMIHPSTKQLYERYKEVVNRT